MCSSDWAAAFAAVGMIWGVMWGFVSLARIALADAGPDDAERAKAETD